MLKRFSTSVIFLCCAHAMSARGAAIGIGVNFAGTTGLSGTSLNPGVSAGVVPLANYNNFAGATGTISSINDSAGSVIAAASLSVTQVSGISYGGDVNTVPATADGSLMKGYITSGGASGASVTDRVSLTLPPALFSPGGDFSGGFDLLIFSQNNSPNDFMVSSFTVNGVSRFVENAPIVSGATFNGTFTESTLTAYPANNTQSGNYVRFDGLGESNLTANVLTITFTTLADAPGSANGFQRGALNGFELVAIPEPGSLVIMGGTALTSLTGRSRRRHHFDRR